MIKNTFFLLLGLGVVVASFISVLNEPAPEKYQPEIPQKSETILRIGEKTIQVEVADTDSARQRGLSGRAALAEDRGMLFVFPKDNYHGIWMSEMDFAIDIFWLDEELRVVWIERGVTPQTFPKVFYPTSPARYVLELVESSSFATKIDIGSQLFFDTRN